MAATVYPPFSVPAALGLELRSARPAIRLLDFGDATLIARGRTGQTNRSYPNIVQLSAGDGGLREHTVLDLLQVASVPANLLPKQTWGELPEAGRELVKDGLRKTLGLVGRQPPQADQAEDDLEIGGKHVAVPAIRRGHVVQVQRSAWSGLLQTTGLCSALAVASDRCAAKANTLLLLPLLDVAEAEPFGPSALHLVISDGGMRILSGPAPSGQAGALVPVAALITRCSRVGRELAIVGRVTAGLDLLDDALRTVVNSVLT